MFQILQPAGWVKPAGYSNGIVASGRQVFIAGQVGWNEREEFDSDDFVAQVEQTLGNVVSVLAEAGGAPENIVRMTWYITDKNEYLNNLKEVGKCYQHIMGKHFPAMAMVQVAALIEDGAKVEIEATAVIPD
jgi:enamine deaminase RidA (YjgF/YER057c/UK114 family)